MVASSTGVEPPPPLASQVTRWRSDPFSRGSYTYPTLGTRAEDPERLAQPVGQRLLFAGEGTVSAYFGTVHGALMSGVREAQRLGAPLEGVFS